MLQLTRAACAFLLIIFFTLSARAQVYVGDGGGTSGKQGSCCNWVVYNPTTSVCSPGQILQYPSCQVITQAQALGYFATRQMAISGLVNGILITGMAVTFTTSTAASGVYPADPASITMMSGQLTRFTGTGAFVGASALISVNDVDGTAHQMGAPTFKLLFAALQDYAAGVVASPQSPPSPVKTITG